MVERIPSYYANDECTQITLPFRKCITLFNDDIDKNGVLCHYNFTDNSQNINKHLNDNRRYSFPYGNIPLYKGLFGIHYVNVLFKYNKHYISIYDGLVRDRYFVKKDNDVLMLNKLVRFPFGINNEAYTRNEIYLYLAKYDLTAIFDRYGRDCFDNIDNFINNGGGVIVFSDSSNIKIKMIKIMHDIGFNNFLLREKDIAFNDYEYEELKCFSSKIKENKKVTVYSFMNPNIDKSNISENKGRIRSLSKNERK